MHITIFKKAIVEYLGIGNVFLFWKGRVALYAILKALDIKEGDEVILPAFTCVVVANPIIYLGAKPVYVDIDPLTLNIDPKKIEEKITKKTKVIIAQNTFGLSSNLDSIFEIANKYNLFVIEDCAHGFGGTFKGKKNGTIADASFFSTQWNKPFSTGIGGIAVTKHDEIAKKIEEIEKKAVKPSYKEKVELKILVFLRNNILNSNTYWFAMSTYRMLSKKNLVIGSSQGYELESPTMPENFLKSFSDVQAKEGLKYFEKQDGRYLIDIKINHRKKGALLYNEMLKQLSIEPLYNTFNEEHTYLKYPLLVRDRNQFLLEAQRNKVQLGDWFLSPIHPIKENFAKWYYNWGSCPIAEKISQHIINLPTDYNINEYFMTKLNRFLQQQRSNIYNSINDCLNK
jgi:dTDP-4-amino-4,6-dideoxygalactose transaminase